MKIYTILLALTLTACGTTNVKKETSSESLINTSIVIGSITQKQSSEGHQGFSSAVSGLKVFFFNLDTGKHSRIETDPWMLGSMSKGDFDNVPGRGKLFVIELSPGKYAFRGWHATQGSYTSVTQKNPKEFSFEVQPGKVIYIGELEFSFIFAKNIFGIGILSGAEQTIIDSYDRDIKIVEDIYPNIDINKITKRLMTGATGSSKENVNRDTHYIPSTTNSP